MATIGYHASHEQFPPDAMLDCVKRAEAAGFVAAMSSDHLAPWGDNQGHSGFALSWLGAALEATRLPFGMVTTPIGLRYHPVIVAQAGATLAQMYPSRLWMALGSGEALNERAVGMGWPGKEERNARLGEAVDIMRALWAGETVTRHGHIPVDEAKLYSLPAVPPRLIGAALSPQTARWAGGWADGLVTVNQPRDKLRDILQAFAEGGGAGKPAYLQVHVSYAASQAEAEANAVQQWRTNALPSAVAAELRSPEMFDAATAHVAVDHLRDSVRMSSDLALHADWIGEDLEQGFEALFLHNVGRNQHEFIEVFGRSVLPQFAGS